MKRLLEMAGVSGSPTVVAGIPRQESVDVR